MMVRIFGLAIGLVLLLIGCGSRDLDRSQAESLIKESERLKILQTRIPLHPNADSTGRRLRWWRDLSRIKSGESLQGDISNELTRIVFDGVSRVETKVPVELNIEVTGVSKPSDAASVAIADFKWRYLDIKQKVAYIAIEGGYGRAVIQKYDDGWRVVDFPEFRYSNNPYALSESQLQNLEVEVVKNQEAERNAIIKEDQARRERIARADNFIVGTWRSHFGGSAVVIRYRGDGVYERLYNIGGGERVQSRGVWRINGSELTMQEREVEWANGVMHPSKAGPNVLTIKDITKNTYVVDEPAVFLGGKKGFKTWNANRIN